MVDVAEHKVAIDDEMDIARNVIETILKSKKVLNLYPSTNPIYVNNLDNACNQFKEYFHYQDELTLKFSKNDIYYNSESIYHNTQRNDNLALLFFKDGLREITFNKDVPRDEIEDFIYIISLDFDRDNIEDDIVTLFWQKDFQHIKYIAEDIFLAEDEAHDPTAIHKETKDTNDNVNIMGAYEDSIEDDAIPSSVPIMPLTTDDFKQFLGYLKRDSEGKNSKFLNMIFEIYNDVERIVEYEDIGYIFMKTFEYLIKEKEFKLMADALHQIKASIGDSNTESEIRKQAIKILLFVSGKKVTDIIGDILDREVKIEKNDFQEFVSLLDQNAIAPFINLLGELQSVHARKTVVDALVSLGPKDVPSLLKGLKHPEWHVVRNIIFILREIGDATAVEHIKIAVKHEDSRVRKEAVRALGEMGGENALRIICECLDDEDFRVRKASLAAIAHKSNDHAKRVIIEQILKASFAGKELDEKKEYFRVLVHWNDESIYDFCIKTITKKFFWNSAKHYETKACAAYSLGLLGNRDALPILNKFKTSRNKLLANLSNQAIRRIESGG
jgi:HEAT repeat protein